MFRRSMVAPIAALGAVAATAVGVTAALSAGKKPDPGLAVLQKVNHIVVLYEENHSFDNLYGGWEGTNNLANADTAHQTQRNQSGTPYNCLMITDVNLAAPQPLSATCQDSTTTNLFSSHFNATHFDLNTYLAPDATTCPTPGPSTLNPSFAPTNGVPSGTGLPGGCTRDIVHRFYQEQYQIDNGKMDHYITGSDATGLVMGTYDTKQLPIYKYLHSTGHPKYAIADDFFQGGFGGSFFNHQVLICACAPIWTGAPNDGGADDLHAVVDGNGMPNNYPLYASPLGSAVRDPQLTASCSPPATRPATPSFVACGDYAVNTSQPWYQPYTPGTADTRRLPPQTQTTIGDELSAANIDWAWYAGGWSNANGDVGAPGWTNGTGPTCSDPYHQPASVYPNCPDADFQFHHQPFNYYKNYATGTPARTAHLLDQAVFDNAVATSKTKCNLKPVSFVKPIGELNEHPGYASEFVGNTAQVSFIKAIEGSACAKDTMIIVTYDEFGGQWDHVSPPGTVGGVPGAHDKWGPGTRIPALVISPLLKADFVVDHVEHDTTAIMTTIEKRWNLKPIGREAHVASMATAFKAKPPKTT
jgi:acid phosphatase